MDKEKTEDLEKIRDERCFPIVRNVFKEFPAGLVVDTEKQKELQLKMLSVMLSADLNVAQEVSYVSQLILGVFSGLNRVVNEIGRTNDEERYDAIAGHVLMIVVSDIDNIKLGTVTPEESTKDFANIKDKLTRFFETENLSEMEVKYVMQKVFEAFTNLNNAVSNSISSSTARMEAKILGIEFMSDLSLKKLNEVLLKA